MNATFGTVDSTGLSLTFVIFIVTLLLKVCASPSLALNTAYLSPNKLLFGLNATAPDVEFSTTVIFSGCAATK